MADHPSNPKTPGPHEAASAVGSGLAASLIEATQINKYRSSLGHGFAAEDANALVERIKGLKVEQVGKSNTLNGADRLVEGLAIQTKYCSTAQASVDSAFGSDGLYRYVSQVLEVPQDQHAACVELMRHRIAAGQVPGVSDPAQADSLVKKGAVTYRQAVNIARAGTIEGLMYDLKTHSVSCASVGTLSFVIAFAHAKWSGDDNPTAARHSLKAGASSALVSATSGVAASQFIRTDQAAVLRVGARKVVSGVYGTRPGKEIVSRLARVSLGKAVGGGAAINHVAKLIRTNAVVSTMSVLAASTPDLYRACIEKSVSWSQLTKNLVVRGAGAVGGAGGWVGGAIAGAALGSTIPLVGTAVGGFVGGMVGSFGVSTLAGHGSKKLLDKWKPDDLKQLLEVMPPVLSELAYEHLLFESETQALVSHAHNQVSGDLGFQRQLFAAKDRRAFLRQNLEPHCLAFLQARPLVPLSSFCQDGEIRDPP